MTTPPLWTAQQLEEKSNEAIEIFRRTRMEEPLEQYLAFFDEYQGIVEELLEATVDLSDLGDSLTEVLSTPKLLEAFRYLAGPPISSDDLKVVAEAVFSRQRLLVDRPMVDRIRQVVISGLDRARFPWVIERREPTESERVAAVVASAALIATRRIETGRRSEGKNEQEAAVCSALIAAGFVHVRTRVVSVLSDSPAPGEFCSEILFGDRKADIVIGLWDRRVMPLECKVSNSSTNSVKRLNNDAAVKAVAWREAFGRRQVVPAAVLGGVFKMRNLADAQANGLSIFWGHDLASLIEWIEGTRPSATRNISPRNTDQF